MQKDISHKSTSLLTLFILLAFILSWEEFVQLNHIPVYILPAPSRIIFTLSNNLEEYLNDSLITLGEAFIGLILGSLTGITAAILLSFWPRLEHSVMTLAILIKSTPMVAIAPLLTIWLGFGIFPKIIITALVTFFPVLVNVLSGLQSTEMAILETFNSWHANRREIFLYARAPHALPYLFAALKVSGPLALIGAVVAEWTGAPGGLGRTMWLAYSNLNLPFLFGAVFILAVAGILLYSSLNWFEKFIVFWERKS